MKWVEIDWLKRTIFLESAKVEDLAVDGRCQIRNDKRRRK